MSNTKNQTQKAKVLTFLSKKGNSLTATYALRTFKVKNLRATVATLRQELQNAKSNKKITTSKTTNGVTKYVLS